MKEKMKMRTVQMIAIGLMVLIPEFAFAHAHLKNSEPAKDAMLEKFPAEIRMEFSERLEMAMSKTDVKNAVTNEVVSEDKLSEGSKDNTMIIKLKNPSGAGIGHYIVHWTAVAKNTHKMEGRYEFSVRAKK
jgi:methionine-rich copper-binding protein CopC